MATKMIARGHGCCELPSEGKLKQIQTMTTITNYESVSTNRIFLQFAIANLDLLSTQFVFLPWQRTAYTVAVWRTLPWDWGGADRWTITKRSKQVAYDERSRSKLRKRLSIGNINDLPNAQDNVWINYYLFQSINRHFIRVQSTQYSTS